MKKLIPIIFSLIVISLLWSCGAKKNLRLATLSYEIGEYSNAIEKYRKAYRQTKGSGMIKAEMAYNMAEAYRITGQYSTAAIWYKNAIRRKFPNDTAMLHYAECLLADQKFEEAQEWFLSYLDSIPDDEQGINGHDAAVQATEWINNPSRYVVNIVKELNSKNRDYAPTYIGEKDNEIVFTSARELSIGNKESKITGEKFADLYTSSFQVQKQKWGEPQLLDEQMTINTSEEEGAAAITSNGSQMYFTRCRYDKSQDLGADIFVSSQSRGEWSEPVKVPLVGDSLISAHPSISYDGDTLYFVSDKIGGFGGKDIWMSVKSGAEFGRPINLGDKINTPGNEIFPFIHPDGTLYFSSEYHIGLGGFDIFKATKDEAGAWQVENMKTPINSSSDDFGITFAQGEEVKGLFSSNRKGSRLDDIYSFYLPPKVFQVSGEIYNKETKQRLNGATIRIIGTDGTMLRMRADGGKFQLKLNPETEYVFAAYKENYLKDRKSVV